MQRLLRLAPTLRVSAACCLVEATLLPELGPLWRVPVADGRGAAVAAWADASGRHVVVATTATVFLPVGVDSEGAPDGLVGPMAADAFEPPSYSHPGALADTSLGGLLRSVGLPWTGPEDPGAADRPFLSIVTRTQGTRSQCLEDVLTCLSGQTNRDFEVVLACHRVDDDGRADVRRVVESQPPWLQERVRTIEVQRPGRSSPLNEGFDAARGRYIVMLDDDDTVLAHWVETFAALERQRPGRLLRATTVRQDVIPLDGHDQLCAVPVGNAFAAWADTFDLADHLRVNHTPCMSVAFPRGLFHDLGMRFDESLPANEDWDFLLRAAGLVGAHSSTEVTSIYRWWLERASSRELHSSDEWDDARERVLAKLDQTVLILPPESTARIREVTDKWRREAVELATSQHQIILQLHEVGSSHERTMASWQLTKERLARATKRAEEATRSAKRLTRQLEKQKTRFKRRQRLMREADDLLQVTGTRAEHPSVFAMSPRQLRGLIATLQRRPAAAPRGRSRPTRH
ncbi:glycosyltransferase family 2 protein [Nocardioides sp. YIM 152315]|uniref:glycosyltransferase family 2 protein n=1 Tax=Nocardioides sp. YIM 152315 TaxID=3031760 RepID=UPI0023DB563E|nr:glycosyltransferase family 2 protein [Nocardioides sp. YIM 152315]MDF1604308.1 glycosyltransferase family 2 protein [Nocardioides sp. YIM 152315]